MRGPRNSAPMPTPTPGRRQHQSERQASRRQREASHRPRAAGRRPIVPAAPVSLPCLASRTLQGVARPEGAPRDRSIGPTCAPAGSPQFFLLTVAPAGAPRSARKHLLCAARRTPRIASFRAALPRPQDSRACQHHPRTGAAIYSLAECPARREACSARSAARSTAQRAQRGRKTNTTRRDEAPSRI